MTILSGLTLSPYQRTNIRCYCPLVSDTDQCQLLLRYNVLYCVPISVSEKELDCERPDHGDDATDTQTDSTIVGNGGVQTSDDGQRALEGVLRALLNQRRW